MNEGPPVLVHGGGEAGAGRAAATGVRNQHFALCDPCFDCAHFACVDSSAEAFAAAEKQAQEEAAAAEAPEDPDAEDEMNPAAVAVHTSYARSATDSWTLPLYQIVDATPESVVPVGPPAGQIVASAGS